MSNTIKQSIKELVLKIEKQNSEDVELEKEMIHDLAKDCANYINCVSNMENAINLARFRLETKDYQNFIMNLDNSRSRTHNVVISGVRVLNKLTIIHNLEPIFTGNLESRIEIAQFAKEYVDELFNERFL